ncbi:phosphorylase Pnp/Udp family protein [Streptococcus mitis]|uniref:Phosphorylase Pnp/Udp family protein n=1 Tax=Streptococcus mitis TaxID=28037 RepID=A0A4U9ZFK3_STRMT|nr:nucleoside phosphorylase [Streptococcus mitis]VTS39098.1 phosphorylase Pnp/Udp family protein [Streptococcus mitis]
MIQKHAIPILEFDDNPQAVIMPNHEGLDLHLPKKCVYAFLGEEIDRYAREVEADCVGEFVSATKTYPVYVFNYKGEEICLAQAPVGSAPAAQFMECSALAAVAQLRGVLWGELLFTADSLADLDQYDSRDWGSEAFEKALELCLEIASQF